MSTRCNAQETIDGDLAARVFGLLQVVDTGAHAQRYGEHSRQRLDIAILGFFQGFRKVYIGEQVMHASKVRQKRVRSCRSARTSKLIRQRIRLTLGCFGCKHLFWTVCSSVLPRRSWMHM